MQVAKQLVEEHGHLKTGAMAPSSPMIDVMVFVHTDSRHRTARPRQRPVTAVCPPHLDETRSRSLTRVTRSCMRGPPYFCKDRSKQNTNMTSIAKQIRTCFFFLTGFSAPTQSSPKNAVPILFPPAHDVDLSDGIAHEAAREDLPRGCVKSPTETLLGMLKIEGFSVFCKP